MDTVKSLRDFKSVSKRRGFLEEKLNISLTNTSSFSFSEDEVNGKNIENLIGAAQIPLGVAGPLILRTTNNEQRTHYIPLATTEGALVASVSRGCKAILESGGAYVEYNNIGVTRAPVFKTNGISQCVEVKKWLGENYKELARLCESTSSHLKLKKIESNFSGKNLFIRFSFDTEDAMGMNMATIATQKAVELIEKETKAKCISLAGNFDIDKKPAWLNFLFGRGKKVWAETTIKRAVCLKILKASPEEIADLVYRKCQIGSALAGSMGFNAHYANIIAAIFIATGQDPAHVVEGSLGITTAEVLPGGNLYFSIYLPSLLIGIVGGGTNLPTQKEAINLMGVKSVLEFAEVVAGAVLAGELSLLASQVEGSLAKAHINLGRKGKS